MYKNDFGYYISVIYRHHQMHLNKRFSKFGFGSGQFFFFIYIAYNESSTQKELSRSMAVDKATTTKAIRKLIALGYVRAEKDPKDLRSQKLYLTEAGKEILPEVRRILDETTAMLGMGMDGEEVKETLRLLRKITGNVTRQKPGPYGQAP